MDTCICMAESLRCLPETITTLFVNWLYHNTKLKCVKKKTQYRVDNANLIRICSPYMRNFGSFFPLFLLCWVLVAALSLFLWLRQVGTTL